MIRLEIAFPDGQRRELAVGDFPAAIGRDRTCAIRLDHPKVSRTHAAIEARDGRLVVVDRGSTNGVRLNGERVAEGPLRAGDELAVGDVRVRVLEAPEPARSEAAAADAPAADAAVADAADAEPAPRRIASFGRRRVLALAGPALAVPLAVGAVAWWLFFGGGSAVDPDRGPDALSSRLARELEDLRVAVARAPRVTVELIGRIEARREEYARAAGERIVQPLDEFLVQVRSRRDLELHNRFFECESRRRELLWRKQYGEALALADAIEAEFEAEAIAVRDRAEALATGIREQIRHAFAEFESALAGLEFPEFREDFLAFSGRGLESFRGTPHEAPLLERRQRFVEELARLDAEAERRARELAARLEARRQGGETAGTGPAPRVVGLSDLLAGPIRAGALRSRTYDLGELRGRPVDVRGEAELILETAEGERSVALADVAGAVQLRLARACLDGDALFEAAARGFAWGLEREAGALLDRYARERGAPRSERRRRIDELLAAVRGLDAVPEGGFAYDEEHGWEDARQRADRVEVEASARLAKRLGAATSAATFAEVFGKLAAAVEDDALSRDARGAIRRLAVDALEGVREKLSGELERLVRSPGLARLRETRVEFDRRRADALRVIFDTGTYLPEDHPDWPRGDRVNGQAEVDRLVRAGRELWEDDGVPALRLSAADGARLERLRLVRDVFFPRLRHVAPAGNDPLEVLWNNLDGPIDLRSFALDRGDAERRRYNRRVAAHNRDVRDPDLPEPDRAHMVFVNDYREMLGLRRLVIDVRLCRATRKHSAECDRAGRIWHNGPDGTPGSRAQAEGFPGGVGENVAIGYANPEDIWTRGWYRASDHHRNALGSGWTCIGYGYVGRVGTQNFGVLEAPF